MKIIRFAFVLIIFFSCKQKEFGYTLKMYFLKRDDNGKPIVEWRESGFDASTDSIAYEYGLEQYIKEGHKPDFLNGTPAKFEVYNRQGKQIIIKHGYY